MTSFYLNWNVEMFALGEFYLDVIFNFSSKVFNGKSFLHVGRDPKARVALMVLFKLVQQGFIWEPKEPERDGN